MPAQYTEHELRVVADDGAQQTIRLVAPLVAAPKLVILGLPAMGTPAKYYAPFARALAERLASAVAFAELRGQGTSSARASRGDRFGYRDIVEHDLPAVAAFAMRTLTCSRSASPMIRSRRPPHAPVSWLDCVALA